MPYSLKLAGVTVATGLAFHTYVISADRANAQTVYDVAPETIRLSLDRFESCFKSNFPNKMGYTQAAEACLDRLPKGTNILIHHGGMNVVIKPNKPSTEPSLIVPSKAAFEICTSGAIKFSPKPLTLPIMESVIKDCEKHLNGTGFKAKAYKLDHYLGIDIYREAPSLKL